jgi:opacity protein-like surface antigen
MTIAIRLSARRPLACAAAIAATVLAWPAFVSPATAADMATRPLPARPLWTGFYFGVHGGGGFGSSRVEDPTLLLSDRDVTIKSSGAIAGGQMGANWQFGNFVIGAELDASWASVSGDGRPNGPDSPDSSFSDHFKALATGTARLGYAAGPWLGYAKVGVAWADIEFDSRPPASEPIVIEHSRTGLAAGAGLEVALFGNLSAKVEYNALYFGSTAMSLGSRNGPGNVDQLLHVVKAGVNLRFGDDY